MLIGKSLVMTDWAANVEGIADNRERLLWELVLHSLLKDQILIQDESLAQSEKLAEWFEYDNFRVLDELIDTGLFSVVVQPPETYSDPRLQDLATDHPIEAKRSSILLKHGKPFKPTERLKSFQASLDRALLRTRSTALRPDETQKTFVSTLLNALGDSEYDKWFNREFGLNKGLRHELAQYVEQPTLVSDRLKKRNLTFAPDPKFFHQPLFTRNLGHLLAQTYPEAEAGINALIHSSYAKAFTAAHDGASGRYNQYLRPLLPGGTHDRIKHSKGLPVVEVEYRLGPNLRLPALTPGLCRKIQNARESDAYRELRSSLKTAGWQLNFQDQNEKWLAFADVIARQGIDGQEVPIWTMIANPLQRIAKETIVTAAFHFLLGVVSPIPKLDSHALFKTIDLTAGCVSVAVEGGVAVFRRWAKQDVYRAELGRAVTFVAEI